MSGEIEQPKMLKPEPEEVLWCENCQEVVEDPEPAYECPECGEVFSRSNSYNGDNHQCPYCRKFSSKVGDECCPDCGGDLDTKEMIYNGEEWVEPEDTQEDEPSAES